jgi:hypothetical protein
MASFTSVGAAAAVAGAACLNARLGFSSDIRQLLQERDFAARLRQMIKRLGGCITLYHMLELADENAEALWFEGRSWSYRVMKLGKSQLSPPLKTSGSSSACRG